MTRIGVVSDTHGTLHDAVVSRLAGVDEIIHAGDIGNQHIIEQLGTVAPVKAITGNVDWGGRLDRVYPKILSHEVDGYHIFVKHIGGMPAEWYPRLPEPQPDVAICGHSHRPLCERFKDVLFLNPGAAGQPRFGRGGSIAILRFDDDRADAEIVHLS